VLLEKDKMTHQALFDVVYSGLRDQGFQQSRDKYGSLAMRGVNDRRCAAGLLVPGSFVIELDDGTGGFNSIFGFLGLKSGDPQRSFLCELIRVHDSCISSPQIMKSNLEFVANKYRLTIPAPARATPLRDGEKFYPLNFLPNDKIDWFALSEHKAPAQASL
jgi:hypothetical protein